MKETNPIDTLRDKVQQLIDDNRSLRAELRKMTDDREKITRQKRQAEEKILELEKRMRVLETAGALSGQEGNNRAARQRVNKLLREIDRCIALMNR